MARPITSNRAAADERDAIVRKIRRLAKESATYHTREAFGELLTWIADRKKRTAARAGGLGRK